MVDKLPHAVIGACSLLPMRGNVLLHPSPVDQADLASMADYLSVGQGLAAILNPSSSQSSTATLMTG